MGTSVGIRIVGMVLLGLSSWMGFPQVPTQNQEDMNTYLLHGKFEAKEGQASELANILIQASELISTVKGSVLYAVSKDTAQPNTVFVTEIWTSKEDHDNSLQIDGVRELIMQAMPLLAEQPQKGQELEILGGTGDIK